MAIRPSVHPEHSRAEINEDLMLALETLIYCVKRSNPRMNETCELAIIIRDAEAVIKRVHWERM